MTTIAEAALALETAVSTVDGLRRFRLGDNIDPPGFIVSAPQLSWEGYCRDGGPTQATFALFVCVPNDDRAMERLWDYVGPVGDAIESVVDAVIRGATPVAYPSGSIDLPSYSFTVEVSL